MSNVSSYMCELRHILTADLSRLSGHSDVPSFWPEKRFPNNCLPHRPRFSSNSCLGIRYLNYVACSLTQANAGAGDSINLLVTRFNSPVKHSLFDTSPLIARASSTSYHCTAPFIFTITLFTANAQVLDPFIIMSEGGVQPPAMVVAEAHNIGKSASRRSKVLSLTEQLDTYNVPKKMFE